MKVILEQNQELVHSFVLGETIDPLAKDLVKTLLNTCTSYSGVSLSIQQLCAECLGVLGAIDPSRLIILQEDSADITLSDFQDRGETIDFVCKLIERRLATSFRAVREPKIHDDYSFVIQTLLNFCGFTTMVDNTAQQRWAEFPQTVRDAVSHLLQTAYGEPDEFTYPVRQENMDFKTWLQWWTLDLISNVRGTNAERIFGVCKQIVKYGDVNVALYILPHLVLNILTTGTDEQQTKILDEILRVLRDKQEDKQLSLQVRILNRDIPPIFFFFLVLGSPRSRSLHLRRSSR
jgi:serine/threonine-protein kinase ATR